MVPARFERLDGLSDESRAGLINECGHAASEQGALSLPSSMRLFFAAVRDLLLAERKGRERGLQPEPANLLLPMLVDRLEHSGDRRWLAITVADQGPNPLEALITHAENWRDF